VAATCDEERKILRLVGWAGALAASDSYPHSPPVAVLFTVQNKAVTVQNSTVTVQNGTFTLRHSTATVQNGTVTVQKSTVTVQNGTAPEPQSCALLARGAPLRLQRGRALTETSLRLTSHGPASSPAPRGVRSGVPVMRWVQAAGSPPLCPSCYWRYRSLCLRCCSCCCRFGGHQ